VGLIGFCALWDKAPNAPFPHTEDTMTTPRFRSLVSAAAALSVAITLAGCAGAPSRRAADAPVPVQAMASTVRFDNGGRDHVRVYLVSQTQEWLLGRVEPGARATLRIPDDALAGNTSSMRLAVVPGGGVTLRAAGGAATAITMSQPASALLSQRWAFSQVSASGELTSVRRSR
jgi:hypothetical protein